MALGGISLHILLAVVEYLLNIPYPDDMMSAIKNFPMPDNPSTADIRSWFVLVSKVAPFLATASVMTPFLDLLKLKNATGKKVYWASELQQLLESTKSCIFELSSRGQHNSYDTNRRLVKEVY